MAENSPPVLRVTGLRASRGKAAVLTDIDFEVGAGEVLALLGPNGAGKSTLLKCILGLINFEGEVRIGGRTLEGLDRLERARSLAYVPQRSLLRTGLTVREVVEQGRFARGRAEREEKIRTALAQVDASGFAERRFTELSVGQQQRVLLARALATEAKILLLDEPTSALDIGQALRWVRLMRSLAEGGFAIVCALHHLGEAREAADRAVLLSEGRIATIGTVSEVLESKEFEACYGVRTESGARPGFVLIE